MSERLSVRTKLGFGVADLGGNLFFTVISFWALNYLTDTVGLAAGLAGVALAVGRLWDAFADPMIGLLSDRTKTRWGRRRPYMLLGAIPVGIVLALFFSAPKTTVSLALFWWAVLLFALLSTAFSLVNIPYGALTPEMTTDYDERTTLNGYRFGFAILGTLCGAALVQPILHFFPHNHEAGFRLVGLIFGGIVAVSTLITGLSVRERAVPAVVEGEPLWRSWLGVWKNRPYRLLLGAYTVHILGITFLSGSMVYLFKYVLHDEVGTTIGMLILMLVAAVSIPFSVLFAKRWGKVRAYQAAMLLLMIAAGLVWLFGKSWGAGFVEGVMALAGIGLGFSYAPPYALLPDTIEVMARQTGRREEGAHYGLWNFSLKLAQMSAVGLSGWILAWAGYVADHSQTGAAMVAIQTLAGPVPAFLFLAAGLLLFRYPLDQVTYDQAIQADEDLNH
ncbi:MAG: MFS transporter [Spirochaetales bacterium]|nr:MFS transporter [Spirochaetales bacterium]